MCRPDARRASDAARHAPLKVPRADPHRFVRSQNHENMKNGKNRKFYFFELFSFRSERRRNHSDLARSVSSEATDIEIVPKRESLRRVLELSKQEYENKNKNTENPTSTESEPESESDEPKTEPGKFH